MKRIAYYAVPSSVCGQDQHEACSGIVITATVLSGNNPNRPASLGPCSCTCHTARRSRKPEPSAQDLELNRWYQGEQLKIAQAGGIRWSRR